MKEGEVWVQHGDGCLIIIDKYIGNDNWEVVVFGIPPFKDIREISRETFEKYKSTTKFYANTVDGETIYSNFYKVDL